MPRRWAGAGWREVMSPTNLRYTNELVIGKREIYHAKEMLIANWLLPAAQADAYQELVGKARTNLTTILGRVTLGRVHATVGGLFGFSRKQRITALWLIVWIGWLIWLMF